MRCSLSLIKYNQLICKLAHELYFFGQQMVFLKLSSFIPGQAPNLTKHTVTINYYRVKAVSSSMVEETRVPG